MTAAVVRVQHLLGTAHTARIAALARALSRRIDATHAVSIRPPATLNRLGLAARRRPPVRMLADPALRSVTREAAPGFARSNDRAARVRRPDAPLPRARAEAAA